MAKPDSIGQFEQLVLTAVLSLKEDAYGVTIHEKVGEVRPAEINLTRRGVRHARSTGRQGPGFIVALGTHGGTRRPGQALLPHGGAGRAGATGIRRHR